MIRKHLSLTAAAIVAGAMILSCGKDKPAPTPTTPDEPGTVTTVEVESLKLDLEGNSISIAENAGQQYIDVIMEPKTALVEDCLRASVENEDIIKCSLYEHSIGITPKKIGSTKLTLRPKSGPVDPVTLTVTVTEKPAKPVSITIAKSGSGFADGNLMLTVDDTYTLSATTKDDKGGNSLEAKVWTVTNGDDVVSVDETSGKVTALKEGVATISVHPVSDESIKDEVPVSVTGIASVKIDRSGEAFVSGNTFNVTAGGTIKFSASVKNGRGETVSRDLTWAIESGSGASIDQNGLFTAANSANGQIQVSASVKKYPSIKDVVTVGVVPIPTGIEITGWNSDTEINLKEGESTTFTVKVIPANAAQTVNIKFQDTANYNMSSHFDVSEQTVSGGKKFTVRGLTQTYRKVVMTVSPKSNDKITESRTLTVDLYYSSDVKSGDYIYYNGNASAPAFKSVDCGLRFQDGSSLRWKSGQPESPSTLSGWTLVGVLVTTDLPSDDDFLGLSKLNDCTDGTKATGLYEYRNFRKSSLIGLSNKSGVHGLVISGVDSEDVTWNGTKTATMNWQRSRTELIANTTDKGGGLYQYQLRGKIALSSDEAAASYGTFVSYGLLSHLLLDFYNKHLNNKDYTVEPVNYVESLHQNKFPIPDINSGKCTGWFVPGEAEWKLYKNNINTVKPVISSYSQFSKTFFAYWTTMEMNADKAYYFSTGNNLLTTVKATDAHVRPMFYL